jgi:hypothetical protein
MLSSCLWPKYHSTCKLEADMFRRRFNRRFRRRQIFPFWIFAILFFVFMGKSGWWAWMFPFFLFWCFGPMFWASFGPRRSEEEREWKPDHNPIPAQWQTPSQPKPAPREPVSPAKVTTVGQPLRSMAGLPNTCTACGGPMNTTTVEWRNNNLPYCGYCGTKLQ